MLRHYLMRLPYQQRIVRYGALVNFRWLKSALQDIKPEVLPEVAVDAEAAIRPDAIQPPAAHYHQYRCQQGNPLSCTHVITASPLCEQCYFPALLTEKTVLVGKQGQYQIGPSLGRRGIGRLYTGTRLGTEQPVIVQEYLLPERYFSPAEQRQYQDAFVSLAGLALADGRTQDLRIVPPLEAINDPSGERSYVVSPDIDGAPTLNRTCAQVGAFSNETVADILNQVLQTLAFLHQQKFTFPSGQVQTGIVHGNISLDSLLWVGDRSAPETAPTGFVYLTDFALWEKLFDPALADRGQFDQQQDLTALGKIAFFLLNGATVNARGQALNPRLESDWPDTVYPPLKFFILRLLEIEPTFASAEAARLTLLAMPPIPAPSQLETRDAEVILTRRPWYRRYLPVLVTAALLATLGSVAWLLLRSRRPSYAETLLPPCCLEAVGAVPTGTYAYAIPRAAYWYAPFRNSPEPALGAAPVSIPLSARGNTWFDRLATVHPELVFETKVTASVEGAIATVQSGEAEFAIVPLTEPLPPDITATIVAYDSLVPVIAFNYPDRQKGLPDELDGHIRLEQLADIYQGNLDTWRQLRATELPIRRYWADDPTVQSIFAERVLQPQGLAAEPSIPASDMITGSQPQALPPLAMLRQILQDFENDTVGSIGISPLSQALGQCSVYPLALTADGKTVSPLVFEDGRAVDPGSDLCDRKGSYGPNAEALREGDYPLAYPLAVVYPFDNTRPDIGKRVAGLLLTQESQHYLKSLGMVSAYPLENNLPTEPNR
ncbi:MAG: hypothetical protein AAFR42_06425 [Cyanobacteria bacterium J06628_6]